MRNLDKRALAETIPIEIVIDILIEIADGLKERGESVELFVKQHVPRRGDEITRVLTALQTIDTIQCFKEKRNE